MSEPLARYSSDMSDAERRLVAAAARGEIADLGGREIRGAVLRDLLAEARSGWTLPASGLVVARAVIIGGLDLEGAVVTRPVTLTECKLEPAGAGSAALNIRDARLPRLSLNTCIVSGDILADRAVMAGGLSIGGGAVDGVFHARAAIIEGTLALEGARIGNGAASLYAAGIRIAGPLVLRQSEFFGAAGLQRAVLGGVLHGERLRVVAESGAALDLESARAEGDILLEGAQISGGLAMRHAEVAGRVAADGLICAPGGIDAAGAGITYGLALDGARLEGALKIEGARIGRGLSACRIEIHGGETAIGADVVVVAGNVDLKGAKLVGQISCPGAEISGQFRLTGARLFGAATALRADGAVIRGGCFMSRTVVVGIVRFPAAEIGNQLRLSGASLKVDRGAALLAAGVRVGRDVELDQGFKSVGGIVLDQARISGTMTLADSHVISVALSQHGHRATKLESEAQTGERRLDAIAISLVDATIDRLKMPERAGERPRGIVDLSRAHVGAYEDYADAWPPPSAARAEADIASDIDHLVLDCFRYDHLANPSGRAALAVSGGEDAADEAGEQVGERRIAWLEGQPIRDIDERLNPQAWVYLARRLREQGFNADARVVTIAQRRHERRSPGAALSERWHGRLLDALALYGYNPWRTVAWMATTVAMFALLHGWAAGHCARTGCFDETVFAVTNRDAYSAASFESRYPPFNALAYSLDVFAPFVSFGYEDHWRPNLSFGHIASFGRPEADNAEPDRGGPAAFRPALTWGVILYIATIIEAILGLVLTSLAVTGFTGLLRRDD
ncbi:MAG: hypothetical protein KDJ37_06340 [Hyphomicrobiaceae bacterium]|nr:hypothetical protein [Hyphomicrobiaceae bacterium]